MWLGIDIVNLWYYTSRTGIGQLNFVNGPNVSTPILGYTHYPLNLCLDYNQGRSEGRSDYILGKNLSPLYFRPKINDGRSEGEGVKCSVKLVSADNNV